jgi:hypothetical protein
MGTVNLEGSLSAGSGSGDCTFPSMAATATLNTSPSPKSYQNATGTLVRLVASPVAYAVLSGVGVADTVTECDFLYLRTNATVLVRLTQSASTKVLSVSGTLIIEPPTATPITLVEVQGSATVEYFASGQR